MALAKISRNYQIIIYAVILVSAAVFLFYFYRQATIAPGEVSQTNLTAKQTNATVDQAAMNINIDLFSTKKFINLRSEVAPTTSFQSGKRNPFQSQ